MPRKAVAGEKDFGDAGIDIQTAMLRHVQANPDRAKRTKHIVWNGQPVWTSFDIPVPTKGRFQISFVSEPRVPSQGVDVKAEDGTIALPGGETVQTLRTWHDPRYVELVEYPF